MLNLKKRLPPLDPLVSFEAAARHMSFTRAAEELSLSQAAVSQQIRNLENNLGVALFTRAHRSIILTSRGRELQHTVSAVLNQLSNAAEEMRVSGNQLRLTIAADQSIASMWLMPRLSQFQHQFSEVSVRLIASDLENDWFADEIQLSIVHGNGNWPGMRSEKLFNEEIFPVCSRAYLKERSIPIESNGLVNEILLDLDDGHWNWMNWRTWLSQSAINLPAHHRQLQVNSYPLLIDAVKNGQGIALGWKHLVDDDITKGHLVRVTEESVTTNLGYYLVWNENRAMETTAKDFLIWCKNEIIH